MSEPQRRRAWLTAVAVVSLAVLFIGYLAIVRHKSPIAQRPTECVADGPTGQGWTLGVDQASIAAIIAAVADRRAMPARALAIAYAAALQESDLANLNYGDRDSLGVFQQRPSEGWGSPQQIENPVYASNRFFEALAAVPRYQKLPIYQAAQDVQHSADGQAYGEWATVGSQLALAFSGQIPHAVWCSYAVIQQKPTLAAASRALSGSFGQLTIAADSDPPAGRGSSGKAVRQRSVRVASQRQGWAVAAWLVCNARLYGIRDVRYRGYEWLSYTGNGHWARQRTLAGRRAAAGLQAASGTVVFG